MSLTLWASTPTFSALCRCQASAVTSGALKTRRQGDRDHRRHFAGSPGYRLITRDSDDFPFLISPISLATAQLSPLREYLSRLRRCAALINAVVPSVVAQAKPFRSGCESRISTGILPRWTGRIQSQSQWPTRSADHQCQRGKYVGTTRWSEDRLEGGYKVEVASANGRCRARAIPCSSSAIRSSASTGANCTDTAADEEG